MASHTPSPKEGVHVGTKYQTYKAATASVAGWLAKQAHKLGLTTCGTSDATESRGRSKYALSVDDYFAFTQAIVDADPRIGIPLEIVNLAGKAYSLRKEWAQILRGQDEESDKRHAHFISVIGQVFEQLKAHCDVASPTASHQDQGASNGKTNNGTKVRKNINSSKKGHAANQFDPLRAEAGAEDDWSDQEDETESSQVDAGAGPETEAKKEDGTASREARRKAKKLMRKKKSKANRKAQEKAIKEHEELLSNSDEAAYLDEGEEDPYFVIMCLLSDLSLMRDFVKEMWADYSCNKIDLVTVSLTTNATFDIIRTYELDCPAIAPLLKDYSKTLNLILGQHLGDEKDEGLKCLFNRRNTPKQFDTMCSSLCWIEGIVELTCANAFYFLNGPRHDLVWHKPDGQGMGINLTRDPFGPLVQDLERYELIYDDRLMHDIRLLASYAQDVYATNNHDTCMPDHFTMQWKEFARTGNKMVSLSEAFGAQMYLDIHHLCHADLSSAFLDLKGKAWQLHQALTAWEEKERIKRKAMWEGDLSACMTISFTSDCAYTFTQQTGQMVIDKRLFIEQKNALYVASGLSDRFDEAKDKSFLEKSPLLCGISQFILLSGVRECGLTVAVHPRSILSAGQLYFACRMHRRASGRKGTRYEQGVSSSWADYISNASWPDMEYLFEMLGEKAFFEGRVPTSNHEIVQHNGTVRYFDEAAGKKTKKTQVDLDLDQDFPFPSLAPPKAGDRPYKRLDTKYDLMHYDTLDVARQLYHKKYVIYHPSAEHFALTSSWTEGSLLALLGSKYSASCRNEGGGEELWEKVRDMSHLSLLKSLKRCLRDEARALHFDMLSFHMRCIDLLTAMRDKLFKTIHRLAPVDVALFRDDGDAKIMWLACKLYFAASAKEIQGGLWQVGKTPSQPVPLFTSKLHVAIDKTLQDFLTSHGCRSTEIDKVNDWHCFCQLDAQETEYYRLKRMLMNLRTC